MSRVESVVLGYAFVPVPEYVLADALRGALAPIDFVLLAYLYGRANFGSLGQRQRTPRRTLKQIADALHLDVPPDTLSKRLRRLKERGYLTWHVERLPGRPRTGRDVYVFELHPDGPREAEKVLPSPVRDVSARACPSSEGQERRSGAAVSASEPRGVSEFGEDAETDLMSELPG